MHIWDRDLFPDAEQEKVVFAFQQQQYDLLKQWRTSFGVLSFGLSAFFAYHALNQVSYEPVCHATDDRGAAHT